MRQMVEERAGFEPKGFEGHSSLAWISSTACRPQFNGLPSAATGTEAWNGGEVGESGFSWHGGGRLRDYAQEVLENPIDKDLKVDNLDGMNRLTIEIEPEQHRQIKTLATFSGMTIKEFILSKTIGPQPNASGDATDRLMGSAKNAARLREAMATPDSEHRVFKSVEDLKNALGI